MAWRGGLGNLSRTSGGTYSSFPPLVSFDADGDAWAQFLGRGIVHWRGTERESFKSGVGPTSLWAGSIAIDRQDNIWAGFFSLFERALPEPIRWPTVAADGRQQRGAPEPYPLGPVNGLIDIGGDDSIWIGLYDAGVVWNDSTWHFASLTETLHVERVRDIAADNGGGAWIAHDGGV